MKQLFIEKFNSLNEILGSFFRLNYTRSSTPIFYETSENEIFKLACRIYKRGFYFVNSKNITSHKEAQLEVKTFDEFITTLMLLNKINNEQLFFLIDKNFLFFHPNLQTFLSDKIYFSCEPSESSKSLHCVKDILTKMPENTKSIFVLGGGITLDIGGFIAGLLNLPVHYLPTTLLSCVDASVGGKTGVNFSPFGKNQVGLFHFASSLFFVAEALNTLPKQEIYCGVVEAAKHAYLFGELDADLLVLEKIRDQLASQKELIQIVLKNYQYKSHIVSLDPLDKNGIRSSLNLGHTFAHLLESLGEQGYVDLFPHGIAVAHGLKFLMDFKLIENKNNFYVFLNDIIKKYPIFIKKQIDIETMNKLLSHDKKNSTKNTCSFSLPKYGQFSFHDNNLEKNKITQEFPLNLTSKMMIKYLEEY